MKFKIIAFCLCLFILGCKDSQKDNPQNETDPISSQDTKYDNSSEESSDKVTGYEADTSQATPDRSSDSISANTNSALSAGKYIKTEHLEDSDCSCYCININLSTGSELCLKENELYINSRYSKSGNKINVYYTGKSSKTTNKDLPWDKFETNTPIAVLNPTAEGNFKLDWKGFSIDGDIAVDYAIYGKKTLEGTYTKQ